MKKQIIFALLCMLLCLLFVVPAFAADFTYNLQLLNLEGEEITELNYHEIGKLSISLADQSVRDATYELNLVCKELKFYSDEDGTIEIPSIELIMDDTPDNDDKVEVYVKPLIKEDKEVVTITVATEDNPLECGKYQFSIIGPYLNDVKMSVDNEIIVNDRSPVTFDLVDQDGAAYSIPEGKTLIIEFDNPAYDGQFFKHQFGGDQGNDEEYGQVPINQAQVSEGQNSVTVYFQPFPQWQDAPEKITITATYSYEGIEDQPIDEAEISLLPAGKSYIRVSLSGGYREYDYGYGQLQTVGKPIAMQIDLYDQYGHKQPADSNTKVKLFAIAYEDWSILFPDLVEDDLKFYQEEACETEITEILIPEGQTSVTVYAKATKACEYELLAGLNDLVIGGMDEGLVTYTPAQANKVVLSTNDEDQTIKALDIYDLRKLIAHGEPDAYLAKIFINAYDEFGNLTGFIDPGLTATLNAQMEGGINAGHFYDDHRGVITQISVEDGSSKYGYVDDKDRFIFISYIGYFCNIPGEVTISVTIPGFTGEVAPLKLTVEEAVSSDIMIFSGRISDPQNPDDGGILEDGAILMPGDNIIGYVGLLNDDQSLNLDGEMDVRVTLSGVAEPIYEASLKTCPAIAESGYWSISYEEELIEYILENYTFNFVIPEDYAHGTVTIEASFGEIVEKQVFYVADIQGPLAKGWNLISTPYTLANNQLQDMIDIDLVEVAYEYVNSPDGGWKLLNKDSVIEPLKAYYLKLKDDAMIRFATDKSITVLPSRELNEGWNLVGQAYDVLNDQDEMPLMEAFQNIANGGKPQFNIVVNPALNNTKEGVYTPDSWIYTGNGGDNSEYIIRAFDGYWVHMLEKGVLTGFSSTPVEYERE